MLALEHRVRVFVFDLSENEPRYLLLRLRPRDEWPLGPVVGPVGLGDHIRDAIRREVAAETGLLEPMQLIDLAEPTKDLFGDVGLVEWPYAWQAGAERAPAPKIQPGPQVGEWSWMDFEEAFLSLQARRDRDALIKLQLRLAS